MGSFIEPSRSHGGACSGEVPVLSLLPRPPGSWFSRFRADTAEERGCGLKVLAERRLFFLKAGSRVAAALGTANGQGALMATLPASGDAAFMGEKFSGGLSLPFTVTPTLSPQQTPETKLTGHQPEFTVSWNVCIVWCCETTQEDEPCLMMCEIRNVGGGSAFMPVCVHSSPTFLKARPPESLCVCLFFFVWGTGVSG